MNWSDEGIILSKRKHGEQSIIITLMTAEHGRHAGLVRGGAGRRARGIYETGNYVSAAWRARLEEHLGTYNCELLKPNAAIVFDHPIRLAGLSSACAVIERALPEREPHREIYDSLLELVNGIENKCWVRSYIQWELNILKHLGFGLDLTACVATGSRDDLIYVSPRSGQAVSEKAGAPYKQKLLPLPSFLVDQTNASRSAAPADLVNGLELTGHFFERQVFIHHKNGGPLARVRFVDRLKQLGTISST